MTYQVKIQLKHIKKPPVWRRVLIPEELSFDGLHLVIQTAFGWQDCHMYQFSPGGWGSRPVIKLSDPEYDYENDEFKDSAEVTLAEIFTAAGQTFNYKYDFGDDWDHTITFEEIAEEKIINPICIGGKGKCPPEDCGGHWGYMRLLEVLSDPKDPEYKDTRAWLGLKKRMVWDVNAFEVAEANKKMREFD